MKAKKILALVLCAVLLVAGSVMGTFAYLTSSQQVTNTFSVGKVAITLDELDVDNSTEGENDRDQANAYHLLPGETYTKDPTVHVDAASEDCYLFVKVENGLAGYEGDTTIAAQMAAKGWVALDGVENVWYYGTADGATVVSGGADKVVFEKISVAEELSNEKLAELENATVKVTAYAIQASGMDGKTAAQIWALGNWA